MAQLSALQSRAPESQSSATASCPALTRNLSRGMHGDDVRQLQQFLIAKDLLASDSATGFFGALTERAVQQWQAKNGITSSGTPATTGYGAVGPRTRAAVAGCSSAPPLMFSFLCAPGTHPASQYDAQGYETKPLCVSDATIAPTSPSNPGSCTPLASQTQALSCPAGQTGSITQTRTSGCPTGATSPVWGAWRTSSNTCQSSGRARPPSITQVRSTTYYDFPYGGVVDQDWGASSLFRQDLQRDIPRIKQAGFDTLWFIVKLQSFVDAGAVNANNIADMKFVLDTLRSNNMKAILPLTYGTDACPMLTNQQAYRRFVGDHETLLRQIEDYSDMVYIVVFTESVWGCTGVGTGYQNAAGGEQMSQYIRSTLGHLPADLPPDIRAKFVFGFHDSFIAEGWNEGTSAMYAGANSYDFLSFVNYYDGMSVNDVRARIDAKITRIRALHPTIPLFSGETGSSYCTSDGEAGQAATALSSASRLVQRGIGINVWQWKPINFRDADSTQKDCNFGGHAITNPDGSFKEAARVLQSLLTDSPPMRDVTSIGVNTAFQPWAVWIAAPGLESAYTVHLFDADGKVWVQNVVVALAADKSWMSFQLPGNMPPSRCNSGTACAIRAQIVTPASSQQAYNPFTIDLPSSP